MGLAVSAVTMSIAVTGLAATAAPIPLAATGGGHIGLRLLDEPAEAVNDPRARVYIVDRMAPGATIHRRIDVTNTTSTTAHAVVYAAGAAVSGGSFLPSVGHNQNDLSGWTSITPASVDVPPGGHSVAVVTVAIPVDAAPGERYGAIWAELRSEPSAAGGVVQVSRVGIRMYVSVGPGGAPPPDFTVDGLIARRTLEGLPQVIATVHNTGGRALDLTGGLQLNNGPGGLTAGPFAAVLGATLGVGASEQVSIALDKQLPLGPWDATVTVTSGPLERKAQGKLSFPAVGSAAAVVATSLRPGWIYPAIGGAALLVIALATYALVRRARRSRRSSRQGKHSSGVEPRLA